MDSNAMWSTLHSVTSIKRQELAKQRDACRALRAELLEPVDQETDERARVRILLKDAGKRIATSRDDALSWRNGPRHEARHTTESTQHQGILALADISAPDVRRFLEQSKFDASLSPKMFSAIEKKFRAALHAQEIKYEYATLFSDLVTEQSADRPHQESEAGFEHVGRREMQDQRHEWESLVFTQRSLDQEEITKVLEKTFGNPEARLALAGLRKEMDKFCRELQQPNSVDVDEMRNDVNGLIASDLLSDEQTSILKQVHDNPTWLHEMVDVMNLRLASIERWTWETDAMSLEMRRQLNGKYRVFMHEEITQALLIYHVGIQFAVQFAQRLDTFYRSSGWKQHAGISKKDRDRLEYFIGNRSRGYSSIEDKLKQEYQENYFMSHLPRTVEEGAGGYGDDALKDSNGQKTRVQHSIDTKQSLLHLITTESLLADFCQEELIVLQTDFRWFGPSLSHSTIAAVMKFFGVSKVWLDFFDKFLRAPLRFLQDGSDGAIRTRQCGVPMSHILGDVFGEATLFCVDFAVNEATKGRPMFRLHDDIWLWGTAEQAIAGWKELLYISKIFGLSINEEKTGAARLTCNEKTAEQVLPKQLPTGPLQWGLLNVQKGGKFIINQSKIDEHIDELRRQLASRRSVMAWIKAYNTYMQFFALHFCRPANALGRAHVDDCLGTLRRIHQALFDSTGGDVAAYVKGMIDDRFQVSGIPDGFVYFPLAVGALEMRNPFIVLQSMRGNVDEAPWGALVEAREKEEVEYRRLKALFQKNGPANKDAVASKPAEFLSEKEYASLRRDRSMIFLRAWEWLRNPAQEENTEGTAEIMSMVSKVSTSNTRGRVFSDQEPYWKAIAEMYGPEMGEMFGGLRVVEKGLLPLGMVDFFKGRVRWEA